MRDYNGNFVEADIWRTKAKVPWLLWRKYENKQGKRRKK